MPPTAEVDSTFSSLLGSLSAETAAFMSFVGDSDLFGSDSPLSPASTAAAATSSKPVSAAAPAAEATPAPKPPKPSSSSSSYGNYGGSAASSMAPSSSSSVDPYKYPRSSSKPSQSSAPKPPKQSSTSSRLDSTPKTSSPLSSSKADTTSTTKASSLSSSAFSSSLDSDFSLSFAESLFSSSSFSVSSDPPQPSFSTPAPPTAPLRTTSTSASSPASGLSRQISAAASFDPPSHSTASASVAPYASPSRKMERSMTQPKVSASAGKRSSILQGFANSATATASPASAEPTPQALPAAPARSSAFGRSGSLRVPGSRASVPQPPVAPQSSLPPLPPSSSGKKAVATSIGISGGSAEAAAAIMGVASKHMSIGSVEDDDYDPETAKLKKKQLVNAGPMLLPAREILETAFEGRGRLLSMDIVSADANRNGQFKRGSVLEQNHRNSKTGEFEAILSNPNETKKITSTPDSLKLVLDTTPGSTPAPIPVGPRSPLSPTPAVPAIPAVIPTAPKRAKKPPQVSDDADQLFKVAKEAAATAAKDVTPLKPALKGVLVHRPPTATTPSPPEPVVESAPPALPQPPAPITAFASSAPYSPTMEASAIGATPVTSPILSNRAMTIASTTGPVQGGVRLYSVGSRRPNELERAVVPEPVSVTSPTMAPAAFPGVTRTSNDLLSAEILSPLTVSTSSGSKRSSILQILDAPVEVIPSTPASLSSRPPKPAAPKAVKDALAPSATVEVVVEALKTVVPEVKQALDDADAKAAVLEAEAKKDAPVAPVVSMSSECTQFPEAGTPSLTEADTQTVANPMAHIEIQTEPEAPRPVTAEVAVQTVGEVLVAEVEEVTEEYYDKDGVLIYNGPIDEYVGLPVGKAIEGVIEAKRLAAAAAAATAASAVAAPEQVTAEWVRDLVLGVADKAVDLASEIHRDHRDSAATSSGGETAVGTGDDDSQAVASVASPTSAAADAKTVEGGCARCAARADSATATETQTDADADTAASLPPKICVSKHSMTERVASAAVGVQAAGDALDSELAREARWLRARLAAVEAELARERAMRETDGVRVGALARLLLKRVAEAEFAL